MAEPARRGTGWEAMHAQLSAEATLNEAALYASGGRRLTVEHGQPQTAVASELVQELVDEVQDLLEQVDPTATGRLLHRTTSLTLVAVAR